MFIINFERFCYIHDRVITFTFLSPSIIFQICLTGQMILFPTSNIEHQLAYCSFFVLFSFLFCLRQVDKGQGPCTNTIQNTNYQHHKQNTTLQNLGFRTWVLCLLIVQRLDLTKAKIPSSLSFNCVLCFMSISEVKRKVIVSLVNPRFLVIYLKTYI